MRLAVLFLSSTLAAAAAGTVTQLTLPAASMTSGGSGAGAARVDRVTRPALVRGDAARNLETTRIVRKQPSAHARATHERAREGLVLPVRLLHGEAIDL